MPLNFELLEKLIGYNPSLATAPKVWLASAEAQRSIFAAIEQTITSEGLVPQVITAMLEAGTDVLADQIVALYGDQAIGAILDWVTRSSSVQQRIGENWTRALRHRPESLMSWISTAEAPNPPAIAFIIKLLDPHSKDVIAFGADAWLPFVRTANGRLSESKLIESMTFLLTLGFHNPPSGAAELVASTFETVHGAAAHNKLPEYCWNQLRLQAPTFFFWRTWDRCFLLRSALVEKFVLFGWPTSFFLKAVEEKKTFGLVMDYCEESGRGRWFIRKVAEDVFQGRSQATGWQRKSLSAYYE